MKKNLIYFIQTGYSGAISYDGATTSHSLKSTSLGLSITRPHPDFLPVIDSLLLNLFVPFSKLSNDNLKPAWELKGFEINTRTNKLNNYIIL